MSRGSILKPAPWMTVRLSYLPVRQRERQQPQSGDRAGQQDKTLVITHAAKPALPMIIGSL